MSYSTKNVQRKHDLVQNEAKWGINTAESVDGLPGGFHEHQWLPEGHMLLSPFQGSDQNWKLKNNM
jgi:hypothetical protein